MHWQLMLAAVVLWPWSLSRSQATDADLSRVQVHDQASLWIDKPAADPILVKLSESLTIVMRVEGQSPVDVSWPEELPASPAWHLQLSGKPAVTKLGDDKITRWEQRYLATPLQPGLYSLKLPAITYTGNNAPERKVEWEPLPVRITTRVAKADVNEARDRTSIEELPPTQSESEMEWWPWFLLIIPVVVVGFVFARRRRIHPFTSSSSSHDMAVQELNELGKLELPPDRSKEFFTSLSGVLRRFLERRLQLPATSRTTEEFFAALTKDSPLDEFQRQLLDDILKECDLAKFAPIAPAAGECQHVLDAARKFVDLTCSKPQVTLGSVNGQLGPSVPSPHSADTR